MPEFNDDNTIVTDQGSFIKLSELSKETEPQARYTLEYQVYFALSKKTQEILSVDFSQLSPSEISGYYETSLLINDIISSRRDAIIVFAEGLDQQNDGDIIQRFYLLTTMYVPLWVTVSGLSWTFKQLCCGYGIKYPLEIEFIEKKPEWYNPDGKI